MNELVSVIIPTYDRPQFVTEAIDSVLTQTYPNIELIVVNDGPSLETKNKLRPYMDRIIYVENTKRDGDVGPSSAINAGLRIAKGKYVARLDDDDLFLPKKTEKQLTVFEESPDVALVTSGCFITDEIGRPTVLVEVPEPSDYGPFLSLLLGPCFVQSTVLLRRDCHDRVGLYKNVLAQDYDIFLRVCRYWSIGIVDEPLVKRRIHSGNITGDESKRGKRQQDIKGFILDILDDTSLDELFSVILTSSGPLAESCAYAARGALYLRHDIFDRAEADFHKALQLSPGNTIPIVWLGISAGSQENFRLAESYFDGIDEDDSLYTIAQDARDLMTVLQTLGDDRSSDEWMQQNRQLFADLFRATFDSISGKSIRDTHPRGVVGTGLKASQYNVMIENYPQDGEHLVFNTFTHAMVSIGDHAMDSIYKPNDFFGRDTSRTARLLRRMGILVDQQLDETDISKEFYETFITDMSNIHATILTTYDCNFACGYCIEEGVRKPAYMDEQCSEHIVHWLIEKAKRNAAKNITLQFYGGEPLLNTKPILSISERLQEFAIDKGILLSSYITTNGSLLDGKLLQHLTDYGLISVKVTIDGPQGIHDTRRPFKNGDGSFDIVIGNIQRVPKTVKLVIQTNLDSENVDRFPCLLDYFEESGLKARIDNLVVGLIAPSLGLTPTRVSLEDNSIELPGSQLAGDLIHMQELAVRRGFRSQYDSLDYTVCSMNRKGNMVIIDPLGAIYNCPAFVGRKEFSIGDIYQDELRQIRALPKSQLKRCFQCTYFPICGGGCRYIAYALHGDHAKVHCERKFIENRAKEFIKLRYHQRTR